MPERVGFEPMIEFPLNTLSKHTSSIARLKKGQIAYLLIT